MFAALAVALLLQDSAPDLFKKVEEKYAAAKTLSLSTEVRIVEVKDGKEKEREKGRMQGKLRSKGTGQIHVEYSILIDSTTNQVATYVSDAKYLSMRIAGRPPEKKDHALALGTWSRRFCARTGLTASLGSAFGAVFRAEEIKLDKLFLVTEIADGGKEKVGDVECRIVTYHVSQVQDPSNPLKCRMWVDPARLAVLKHELVDRTTIIRETHSDVTFDADIADDVFKIP